jgi:hypothetical protein
MLIGTQVRRLPDANPYTLSAAIHLILDRCP